MKRQSRNSRKDLRQPSVNDRPTHLRNDAKRQALIIEDQRTSRALAKALVDYMASSARVRRYHVAQHKPDASKPAAQTSVLEGTDFKALASRAVEQNGEMVFLLMENFMDRALAPIVHRRPSKPAKTSATNSQRPNCSRQRI